MNRELYCFDFETTGTDPFKDRPVQVGLTHDRRILMNSLCDPYMPIADGAVAVHGITNEMVQGHPDYIFALWTMLKLLPAPHQVILCGFNQTTYDSVMLDTCLTVVSGSNPKDNFIGGKYDQLDILDLLYRYEPTLPSKKLGNAYKALTGTELVGAHGAVVDCLGSARLLDTLCGKHEKTAEEFVQELRTPQAYSIMPLGKYAGQPIERVPISWAQWMHHNATNMRPDLQATIDWILNV